MVPLFIFRTLRCRNPVKTAQSPRRGSRLARERASERFHGYHYYQLASCLPGPAPLNDPGRGRENGMSAGREEPKSESFALVRAQLRGRTLTPSLIERSN